MGIVPYSLFLSSNHIYIYIYSEFSLTVLETSGGFCDIFAVAFFLFNLILFSLQIETICQVFKNKQRLTTKIVVKTETKTMNIALTDVGHFSKPTRKKYFIEFRNDINIIIALNSLLVAQHNSRPIFLLGWLSKFKIYIFSPYHNFIQMQYSQSHMTEEFISLARLLSLSFSLRFFLPLSLTRRWKKNNKCKSILNSSNRKD